MLWGSYRGVMVKTLDCKVVSKQVRTPVTLLRSLSDKYPGEMNEPPYPPSYGLNSTTTGWNDKIVVLKETTLQLYFKTFIEKINSGNLIM